MFRVDAKVTVGMECRRGMATVTVRVLARIQV